MSQIEEIQKEIENLKNRNKKVELNKAWETSNTRKSLILLITYIVAVITLFSIKNNNPFANAIVPTLGFFLSTLTLPFVKNYWEKKIYKK